MIKYYVPFDIPNFAEIKQKFDARYRPYIGELKWSKIMFWNENNFLDLYPILPDMLGITEFNKIRFFHTPAHQKLGPHIDGNVAEPNNDYWALNIPLICENSDHWQRWFDYAGKITVYNTEYYNKSLHPAEPEKLVVAEKLCLTTPHFVNVGVMHDIINDSNSSRLIATFRFHKDDIPVIIQNFIN